MFHPKDKIKLKNSNIIGTNNFTKSDLNSFKMAMSKTCICNIKFIDINAQLLNSRISKQREKAMKKKNKLGMISKEWLNKYQNEIPCVIIQIIDITAKIIERKDPSLISEDIMLEMGKIKSAFMTSNYILILRNLCNFYKNNHEALIKNNILSNVKYAKDKCIIIVNDNNQFDNKRFVDNLSGITKEEISSFFRIQKNNTHFKLEQCNKKKEMEFYVKNLIKLFTFSFMTHKDSINYSYLFKANYTLRQKIDKRNYKFISYLSDKDDNNVDLKKREFLNIILAYLEIKNISDYIIFYLSQKKNMKEIEINKLIYGHISFFNVNNFLKIKNTNFSKDEFYDLYYKYLYLFDSIWKFNWYKFREGIINNKLIVPENTNILTCNVIFDQNISDFSYLNNLLKLYNFMNKEKDFMETIINKYNNYKYKQINNKFIEKIDTYYEISEDGQKRELKLEETILLYMNKIILNNKDILDINIIYKKLETFFLSHKFNAYYFNLINRFGLIDKNINFFIKNTLEYMNDNRLMKFPKVCCNYLAKIYDLFIKQKFGNEHIEWKYKFQLIIKYLDISENEKFSNEEYDLINNILNKVDTKNIKEENENCNTLNNNIYNCNDLFELKIIYNENLKDRDEIKPFDCLNVKINISLKKEHIFLDIEKIQVYFNSEVNLDDNNKKRDLNKNYKEINISNRISKTNEISFNFNHLIKNISHNYFLISNISIILKNGNVINIHNLKKSDNIILYNKSEVLNINQKIIKVIQTNNDNICLRVGEKENYLYNLQYQKIIEDDNIIISSVSGRIDLKEKTENKIGYKKNYNYFLKKINIDVNCDNIETVILFKENKPFNDSEIHKFNFLIKINEIGVYYLFYNIKFNIIHKNCENEIYTFEENGKILVECVKPFYYHNKIESALYSIQEIDNFQQKIFPTNFPIIYNIYLTNNLSQSIIIKNISFEYLSNNVKINSPFLKIINDKGKNIILSSGDKFVVPSKFIIHKSNIGNYSPIGVMKIIWASLKLNDFPQTKNTFNETIIELEKIFVKDVLYEFEGNYINNKDNEIKYISSYQLKIKNLNNFSKVIQCKILDNDKSFGNKSILSYGKTYTKDIILPKKDLFYLFYMYNKSKNKQKNENIIIDNESNNIIEINEYNLISIDTDIEQSNLVLINQLFFVPNLYSQFN